MKYFFATVLMLLLFSEIQSQKNYGNNIYTNVKMEKVYNETILDLKGHLIKATGENFQISNDSMLENAIKIIQLAKKDSALYPTLFSMGNEASLIRSDGKKSLEIISFSTKGLMHGVYTYLDTLGVRWYQPGDEHTFVPKLKTVQLKIEKINAPDFELRDFFGSFGTPRNLHIDREKRVEQEWQQWKRRNRLGGDYVLKGHVWNDFMWKNGKVLKENPQYMALVKGERVKVATASKFCVSDTGLQQLFVGWMVKQLQTQIEKSPNAAHYILSVEPSDGYGFCSCSGCKKIGSVSNNVFLLANLTAKGFQQISPKAFVNLYAYNRHAAPPTFDLEENVIVQIIPYKYQSYAKPNEMIKAWKSKTNRLFIYDYYGLPITTFDAPLTKHLLPQHYTNRIKQWKQLGIKGIMLETSYGTAATGIGLYVYSRLAWDVNQDIKQIIEGFYSNCFGKNAAIVKQSREALIDEKTDKRKALNNAIEIITNAKTTSKSDSLHATYLTDYKAYLIYLYLLYDYQSASSKTAEAKADNLMNFTYGIFKRKIVHPFPISDFMLNRSNIKSYIATYWNYAKPTGKENKFKQVKQLSNAEIDAMFSKL